MRELLANFIWGLTGERQHMLVEAGRVVWRHKMSSSDIQPVADGTRDLTGRYLLPGFTDAHCHVLPSGLMLQSLNLGAHATRDEVLDALRDLDSKLPPGEWLEAVQYDQNRFPDGRHLSRTELDAISAERPILLSHVSGHAAVANSAALAAAGVDDSTTDPASGEYVRDESGRLTGLALEAAGDKVSAAAPVPSVEQMVDAILAAGEAMADRGITSAADMMTGYFGLDRELAAYRLAAEGGCRIRLRLYVGWSRLLGPRPMPAADFDDLRASMEPATCRVAGIKVFSDGALSSRTAAIHGAYDGLVPEHDGSWSGQLIYAPEKLAAMVRKADEAGYQVAAHSLGDYATDCMLAALESVDDPTRHRLEHVMMLSDDQVTAIARLGVPCAMQPEFLLRLQAAYVRSLGPTRAAPLNRVRSLLDAGVPVGFSSDKPVVPGDPWDGIRTAARRPDGFDPSENVSRTEAIRAYTAGGADICGDGGAFGRLAPGEWADYQIYDEDPLTAERPQPAEVHLASGRTFR